MKHKGNDMLFKRQRNNELMAAYRRIAKDVTHFNVQTHFGLVACQPCSRFWVSEERAASVIGAMQRGDDALHGMRPTKQAMYREIHKRAARLLQERPSLTLADAAFLAVNSVAPCFYMTPRYAREIIYKMLRQARRAP